MNRYSRLDNQSPAQKELEANDINVGRSAHDCSHIANGNTMIGLLTPVLTMECVLNEDIDINLASLIEFRNPTTRQLFNSFRVYFHGYFNALTDLWEGARNWLDNGRSGKLQLNRPNLIYNQNSGGIEVNACTPMSLLNFMGMPAEVYQNKVSASINQRAPLWQFKASHKSGTGLTVTKLGDSTSYFPADVCMAYQRNWRDFYSNKNLLQNNPYWFPNNEDHFILSYSATDCVAIAYENEDMAVGGSDSGLNLLQRQMNNILGYDSSSSSEPSPMLTHEPNNPITVPPSGGWSVAQFYPNLSGIKFRQFRGDRFTTGSPFPDLLRGDLPTLQLTEDNFIRYYNTSSNSSVPVDGNALVSSPVDLQVSFNSQGNSSLNESGNTTPIALLSPESSVTMSDIYTLETLTAFKRKMGMTNGDYADMMESQFGVRPKIHDRKGTYIGGFYQDFAFSSVTQTSATTSGSTPLGTKAGNGISSGSGRIGHIHTTDFGWISVYMSIMPDVYYTQGKPRQFSKKSNLEMYFPLFNNLPAQGIRNDELFISGNPTTDSQPFAFEDRYAEFKSIPNRVCGLMGLPVSNAPFDTARVLARRFSSTPSLNSLFVSAVPENIDMTVFSVVDEPPFDFSIGFSIRRVFPGPYTAVEGSLSSPKLNA